MRKAVLLIAACTFPALAAAQQPRDTSLVQPTDTSAELGAGQATSVTPPPPPPPPPAPRLSGEFVQQRVEERVSTGRNKAIVAAIIDDQGVRFFSAGVTRDSAGGPVDEHTVFEIGSVTKVFTAALLAEMAERGELRLTNTAAMYLPDTMRMPGTSGDSITLLHLATHTSGLPRLPLNLHLRDARNPYSSYGPAQLYSFLGGYMMQRAPGEQYEYSNLGFGLLGHLLSLRGGSTYQALLLERVARPLGMRETMIVLGPSLQQRLATGHDALGGPTSAWDFDVLAGAGALRSTAADMALFVRATLDAARSEEDDQPIARALRATMRPHMEVQGGRAVMGLGWHMVERNGRRLILHNGRTGGYASFIGLDPVANTGVVLLTNSSAPVDDLAFAFLVPASPSPSAP